MKIQIHLLQTVILCFIMLNCKNSSSDPIIEADDIVTNAILYAGGSVFEKSKISFDFRNKSYVATRSKGQFSLLRTFIDSSNVVMDVLDNKSFIRYKNGKTIDLNDSLKSIYTSSVNSVHYFSVLPYGLNDRAVNKILLGEESIKGLDYFKINVTFSKEGGGEDYDDIFVYWFDKDNFRLDYLAYSYREEDGTGMRFREAYNERFVNGLRFVDYNNYKAEDLSIEITDLGNAFENNQLKLLSKIELENLKVQLIDY